SLGVVVAVDRDVDGPWLVDGQELGQCLVLTPGGPPEPAGQPGDGEDDDGDRDGRTHHSATRRGAQLRALPLLPADLDHGRSYASRERSRNHLGRARAVYPVVPRNIAP